MSFTDNGLMRGVLRRSADNSSHQGYRQEGRLTDAIAGPAVADESAVGVGELMVNLDVEGVFGHRSLRIKQEVVGGGRPGYVGRCVLLIEVQNVCAGRIYIAQRNEIIGVGNPRCRILDGLRIGGEV